MTKLQKKLLPILTSNAMKEVESQIWTEYFAAAMTEDYTQKKYLLELRKALINHEMLQHQDVLLPYIVEFNNALVSALRETYVEAHKMYDLLLANGYDKDAIHVSGACYLDKSYPADHPLQDEDRQELWVALLDTGWNPMYESGVTYELMLPSRSRESFDDFIGMTCDPPNWNEGLDPELTKDLHLCSAFHNLFDHTEFALTDFIFCRQFETVVNVEFIK